MITILFRVWVRVMVFNATFNNYVQYLLIEILGTIFIFIKTGYSEIFLEISFLFETFMTLVNMLYLFIIYMYIQSRGSVFVIVW